ncbi:MAG: alanine-glyoxylate transaminase/serine-glyoxylate transaminase/serine-pyruvate transaminase [Candidatus Poriferisodalaceae bacterium]|jgi:alanine-glyoxylate transaminase/serine-glyoxylate transaminase/serine-pyruvate transaminase
MSHRGLLNAGNPMVAIPGPSIVPEAVLNAMRQSMPNIYEGPIVDVSLSLLDDLPKIARTTGPAFITISNGHGAWEMAITNTLSRGDKILILESGRFATSWGELAGMAGAEFELLPGALDGPVDPAAVEQRLRDDSAHEFKAVLVVQTDTSTSVKNDISAIRAAIDAAGHPALFMVDCIASMGCEPFEMDEWGVDVTVAACQKGLMVPPGLGFVWCNDKSLAAHQTADMRTAYWDWTTRLEKGAHYFIYTGTPPIAHILGLRVALDMIFDEGLENVWSRHAAFAGAVHAAVDAWATTDGLSLNIADPAARSAAVTTILTGSVDPDRLRQITEDGAGLTLGLGIGAFDGRGFRIGHMGHLNPPMLLGTLGTVESALHAMDAPLGGSGVAAAARHLSQSLS